MSAENGCHYPHPIDQTCPGCATLADFLLARKAEDEAAARLCAEMFPEPWEVSDRGWRVRIYAGDVPVPDLSSDDEGAMSVRNPVVMEVEPDRHIDDPRWLSERVEHVRRHGPARVLADCEATRRLLAREDNLVCSCWSPDPEDVPTDWRDRSRVLLHHDDCTCLAVAAYLAIRYADHPDYREEWRP